MMRNRVAIIDYGLCNLDSVRRAFEVLGADPFITAEPDDLPRADRIVLPGVGAFPDAMAALHKTSMAEALQREVLETGVPFLGVCLGMQLLAGRSTELGLTEGLGLVDADVVRFEPADAERVPHVGWNEVHPHPSSRLFARIPAGVDFYFVHSYHVRCRTSESVAATTPYCGEFVSAVEQGNIFGVQFHPEKSQRNGFALLENFLAVP
jgi:imidazole glycerol-phosphate synthase subunit HisH